MEMRPPRKAPCCSSTKRGRGKYGVESQATHAPNKTIGTVLLCSKYRNCKGENTIVSVTGSSKTIK